MVNQPRQVAGLMGVAIVVAAIAGSLQMPWSLPALSILVFAAGVAVLVTFLFTRLDGWIPLAS